MVFETNLSGLFLDNPRDIFNCTRNGPFPSYLTSLFQNKSSCKTSVSYENDFDLHENEHVGGTHFLMNGFLQRG